MRHRQLVRIKQVDRPASARERAVVRPGLDQTHAAIGILTETGRDHTARGAAPEHEQVELLPCHKPMLRDRSHRVRRAPNTVVAAGQTRGEFGP